MPDVDVDALPPTQYLILEVLAARHRTGEQCWTFPARPAIARALEALSEAGLVTYKSGVVAHTYRAWLTDAGKAGTLLGGYVPQGSREEFGIRYRNLETGRIEDKWACRDRIDAEKFITDWNNWAANNTPRFATSIVRRLIITTEAEPVEEP